MIDTSLTLPLLWWLIVVINRPYTMVKILVLWCIYLYAEV